MSKGGQRLVQWYNQLVLTLNNKRENSHPEKVATTTRTLLSAVAADCLKLAESFVNEFG